jgi:hypothetical protein
MTSREIMKTLYPGMPEWQLAANIAWLEAQAEYVKDGGFIISPRDGWVVKKVRDGEFEIEGVYKT